MMGYQKWLVASILTAGGLAGSVSADVLFTDSFDNGMINHSDSVNNFWVSAGYWGDAGSSVTENTGKAVLTTVENNNNQSKLTSLYSTNSKVNTFDFFAQPLKFTVSGIQVTPASGMAAGSQALYFVLATQNNYANWPYGQNNNIVVAISGEGKISAGYKIGIQYDAQNASKYVSDTSGSRQMVSATAVTGGINSFELTMSASNWKLVVNGDTAYTWSGAIDTTLFNSTNWGTTTMMNLAALVTAKNTSGSAQTLMAQVDEIRVETVPEPTSMGLLGIGTGLMLWKRR